MGASYPNSYVLGWQNSKWELPIKIGKTLEVFGIKKESIHRVSLSFGELFMRQLKPTL
jgi:hypothetical protein